MPILVVAYGAAHGDEGPIVPDAAKSTASATPDDARIEAILASMTLREKIAQMFVVGVSNNPYFTPPSTRKMIEDLGVGGVGFQPFRSMFGTPRTLAEMTVRLQKLALSRNPAIPLLVVIDQEGGTHQTFQSRFGGTDGPGNMALGALDDPATTRAIYRMMGAEIRSWGANMTYSPVLDMPVLPDAGHMSTKGFTADPAAASRHAAAAVEGLRDAGVIGAIKHFPAGGATAIDPHADDVSIDLPADVLETVHLAPFVAAIEAGAELVMVTSFAYDAYEPGRPASLSARVKIDLLRTKLGYTGLITTGAMDMPAFRRDFGEDVGVLAIRTGADLMLYVDAGNAKGLAAKIDAIADAVEAGDLPASRIDESVRRILKTKAKYGLFDAPLPNPDAAEAFCGSDAHQRIAKQAIADAITLVRNDDGVWPLDPESEREVLVVSPWRYMLHAPGDTWPNMAGTTLGREIEAIGRNVKTVHYIPGNLPFLMERAAEVAENTTADVIVVGTFNAHYDPPQQEMVRAILKAKRPVVVIALGNPFELADFPAARTYLAVYNFRTLAQETAAETLFGRHRPRGRLPVAIPDLYPVGHAASAPRTAPVGADTNGRRKTIARDSPVGQ